MMSDSLFSDAGWFFFAFWTVVVGAVSVAAFRGDAARAKQRSNSRGIHSGAR